MTSPSSRPRRRTQQQQQRRQATTSGSSAGTRRPSTARRAEPVDYSKDYADVRRDLIRIAIFTVLLFGAMIAISFVV